jgi:hypothetical protein
VSLGTAPLSATASSHVGAWTAILDGLPSPERERFLVKFETTPFSQMAGLMAELREAKAAAAKEGSVSRVIVISVGADAASAAPRILFRTEGATSADILAVVRDLLDVIGEDRDSLEADAMLHGRTLAHEAGATATLSQDPR